jgi:hypothetical protein
MPRGPRGEKRPADVIDAAITDKLWLVEDILFVSSVEASEPKPSNCGPYKKQAA